MRVIDLLPSFEGTLRVRNRRPRTIESYGEAVRLLDEFLDAQGLTTDAVEVTRREIEAFMLDQLEGTIPGSNPPRKRRPSTAAGRYRYLQQFWKWAAAEGECDANPMDGMQPPTSPRRRCRSCATPPSRRSSPRVRAPSSARSASGGTLRSCGCSLTAVSVLGSSRG